MLLTPELLVKYPSLKKFEEQDDGYTEWKNGREAALLQYVKTRPDFGKIQGNPSKVLEAVDTFAREQHFLINLGPDKGEKVNDILAREKPKVLVELGGYIGYSAILFAAQMKQLGGSQVHVWSLEYEAEFAAIATELVQIAGLSDVATVVVGTANESLQKLTQDGKLDKIDFLFLDHVEDLYEQDFKVCEDLNLFKTGSCIVADNVICPGAPAYRQYVRNHEGLQSWGMKGLIIPGDLEDELEVSRVL